MNNPRDLPHNNSRVPSLITEGLGYCCLWKFFSLYHDAEVIAARLGVSSRQIRRYQAAMREGKYCCEGKATCLKKIAPGGR